MDWKTALAREFQMGLDARARGKEGQARVCARRAAGVAVREYFRRNQMEVASPSAFDLLKTLLGLPDLAPRTRQAAEYLTLRVNEEFKLPVAVDLLEEARALAGSLLPGEF